MLHNESRNLLVQAYEKTHDAGKVAECYNVSKRTVYRLDKQMRETGSVDLKTSQRGKKPTLTEKDLHDIDKLVKSKSGITIDGIIDELKLPVCNETVRKAVIKLGYVYKKKSFYASERDRLRCQGSKRRLDGDNQSM